MKCDAGLPMQQAGAFIPKKVRHDGEQRGFNFTEQKEQDLVAFPRPL